MDAAQRRRVWKDCRAIVSSTGAASIGVRCGNCPRDKEDPNYVPAVCVRDCQACRSYEWPDRAVNPWRRPRSERHRNDPALAAFKRLRGLALCASFRQRSEPRAIGHRTHPNSIGFGSCPRQVLIAFFFCTKGEAGQSPAGKTRVNCPASFFSFGP
jgi:hypothetical protein